ncbi:MAG: hypothetical protein J6Q41_08210 [Firmicutes bacterium]|nr:hypothetical protein [Bacillota bacterium]
MFFNMIYDNLGVVLFLFMAVITVLAMIRSMIKIKKKKAINITPVGVFNDLPESVTGIKKNKEWEIKEEENEDE